MSEISRHCERSEAIQKDDKSWIASSLALLAMTKDHLPVPSHHGFYAPAANRAVSA
jgi:hypothetical protein